MRKVDGIEKAMTVGSGQNTYKGVSDRDVKITIGRAMAEEGLSLLCIGVKPTIRIDRWEGPDPYKPTTTKMFQSIFTEVITRYKLSHTSGEFEIIEGYGHGTDPQDKSAGKATTYALKYALLYAFLVPTGEIDDSDRTHSDSIQVPGSQSAPATPEAPKAKTTASAAKTATKAKPTLEQKTEETKPGVPSTETVNVDAKNINLEGSVTAPATNLTDGNGGLTPNTAFNDPAPAKPKEGPDPSKMTKEEVEEKEAHEKAVKAYLALDQSKVLRYIIKILNEKRFASVETWARSTDVKRLRELYTTINTWDGKSGIK